MMIGGENFSKCNFVNTEINHDLNPPVAVQTSKSEPFIRLSRSYLDENSNGQGCNDFFYGFEFLNDSQIVEKVLGFSIEQLRSIAPDQDLSLSVLVKSDDANNTISLRKPARVKKYNKPYNNSLFGLFDDLSHLFFIIDTGDNFVQTLKGLAYNGQTPPNIHVIHSVLTLADSAPKTLPDSKNYNSQNASVRLFSWYLPFPITIPSNDRLFMSAFSVNNLKFNAPGWKIRQDWLNNNNQLLYQTFDAKKENSKPLVKTYLNSNLNGILNNLDNEDAKRVGSLNMQKKRSGDYFQIWIAKQFPRYAAEGIQNLIFVRGPTNGHPPQADEATYRARTYFVTGDWPAFCYAIYNQVNAIMIFKHPSDQSLSCTIRVQF
jgi:hypothetical protein